MEKNEISKRIDLLIKLLGFKNAAEFANTMHVSANAITNWKKRGLTSTSSSVAKLKVKFPQINDNWLVYGEGEPLIELSPIEQQPKMNYFKSEKFEDSLNASRASGVPYYNYDFQLGFDPMVIDNRSNADAIFNIEPYNSCTCWCNARGDSMSPTISSGDMVALKRIDDFSYLISGEIYAIITKNELRTIKRVKDKGDKLILIPDNKDYEEQEIPKDVVMHVFLVKGVLKSF